MINQRVLAELSQDIGAAATRDFIRGFVAMLDGRVTRLRDALAAREMETARVAAMSLQSSAVMVGAEPLGEVAKDLLAALDADQYDAACDVTVELFVLSAATRVALKELVSMRP
ncbi:Hpt domain-containing protein [Georgenia wangjunii]|uniref:Hpt domain-containing protein n=1 Tax=Georgenia wangjunii TaxID=3117730 RepID=UPI002F26C145